MTAKQQGDWQAGSKEDEERTTSMSQAAANNNHNSQRLVDGIVNQGTESAVLCWSKAAPEVLGMAGQFPVGQGITWRGNFPMIHSLQHQLVCRNKRIYQSYNQPMQSGTFPMHLNLSLNGGFPLHIWDTITIDREELDNHTILTETQLFTPHQVYAPYTTSFPLQQVYAPWHQNFPKLLQLPRKNSDGAFPDMSTTMTRRGQVARSPAEPASQEFPIIKKRFVSFPNYRAMPQDGPEYPPTAAATTTMTQPGLDKVTEIDGGGGVHKVLAMFDNELEAEERSAAAEAEAKALNLNVAREIEHQQAENLNDAVGKQRHDHKNDDAMDGAKNKREICEQSKLEKAEDHNEPNMRDREQQSICLAREQTIDGNGNRHQHQHQNRNRNSNHQQSGDLSDARESSPEQVDVNLGRLLTRERNPNPSPNRTLPNIELLKSSVRAFLAKSSSPSPRLQPNWDWDWELLDLLTDAIELICGQQETGNLWSEAAVGADMTVSKVSEERETESVDVYPEQPDQPAELDDNNNTGSIEPPPSDMKYELKTASPALPSRSRSPRTESPVSRISATGRIRNVEASVPTTTTRAPLLGDIRLNSTSRDTISSIDADSVLPERTRLRRQRRVRSQDSVEEKPEDVIERLNKLKARISGALSEVKGVLKQYSTESEAESAAEQSQVAPDGVGEPAPVSFRFVKKVRRRSYFDEAEEEKEQAKEGQENAAMVNDIQETKETIKEDVAHKTSTDTKVQREQTPFAREKSEVPENQESQVNEKQACSENQEPKNNEELKPTVLKSEGTKVNEKLEDTEKKDTKVIGNQDTKTLTNQDNLDGAKQEKEEFTAVKQTETENQDKKIMNHDIKTHLKEHKDIQIQEVSSEPPKINGELPKTTEQFKQPAKNKTQAKIEFLAKVQSELKSKSAKGATPQDETSRDKSPRKETGKVLTPQENTTNETMSKDTTPKEATPKETTPEEATPKEAAHKEETPMEITSKTETQKESTPNEPTKVTTSKHEAETKQSVALNSEVAVPDESAASQPPSKIKKKVIVKVKNPRRASIAAVEPSKIKVEPAVEQSDALITQRRPSDSEAIVKRKKKLKLIGDTAAISASTSTSPSPRATSSTTKAADHQRETTSIAEETAASEQLATPEVTAVPAKLPSAKSDQGEATAAAETAAATEATSATSAIDSDPAIGNLAPAGDRIRRASLKLAELVGETVLVVPAATPGPKEPLPESKEPINQGTKVLATPQQVAIAADIAPQIAATLRHEESSPEQQAQSHSPVEATKAGEQAPPGDSLATMPELKVLAGPVQPVKIETVEQPLDGAKNQEPLVKKKAPHLKKLVRKNSIEKEQEKTDSSKLSNILRDRNKINELSSRINKLTPPKKQVKPKEEEKKAPVAEQKDEKPEEEVVPLEETPAENQVHEETEVEPEVEPALEPKKPRKIKKKVIIKRQKRRLSVGDTFFLQPEPEEPTIPEVETIERAIAYVTDDEEDTKAPEEEPEPIKALKSCLHVREYKIGDLVLYAERYRKTQVKWKRGRVLERITSISYKLEIEGKEVPAHVSYIKKYTGRKVRFGGKEYLEIDYEQVAEEERRAASYSIWNMV
ncbi:titin homolog [Drosophila rhopaloa]|uniref:Titin homolog n=1 Tax=Drosophila rhopaloa TaxID=1041015 RepID=A0A6P4E7U2_DRORH|nr:titin homolog [Drosophila rhopaloa]